MKSKKMCSNSLGIIWAGYNVPSQSIADIFHRLELGYPA